MHLGRVAAEELLPAELPRRGRPAGVVEGRHSAATDVADGCRVIGEPDPGIQPMIVVTVAFERQLPLAVCRPLGVIGVHPRVAGEGVADVTPFDLDSDKESPSVGVHSVGGDTVIPEGWRREAVPGPLLGHFAPEHFRSWRSRAEHVELTKTQLEETVADGHMDRDGSYLCRRAEGQAPSLDVKDRGVAPGRQVQGHDLGAKGRREVPRPVVWRL